MKAEIELNNRQDFMRLLYAFLACNNLYSHDKNTIEFDRGDGITLKIDTTVNGITFGKKELDWNRRLGNENIDSSFMSQALNYYLASKDNPKMEQRLLEMEWIWGEN